MNRPKKVLCVMDIAALGRCSLAAAMPVLAACGVQCCPLPASVLSSHTGGFTGVAKIDISTFCKQALAHFRQEGIDFDAVYIGYLGNKQQFYFANAVLQQYPNAFVLVDPAMADAGRLYSSLPAETPALMLSLCQKASLITPNQTEAELLLAEMGVCNAATLSFEEKALKLSCGLRSVLITGVAAGGGMLNIYGYSHSAHSSFVHSTAYIAQNYPGTGDVFAAAVLGQFLCGASLCASVGTASRFVAAAIGATFAAAAPPRHGIYIEPFLAMLC